MSLFLGIHGNATRNSSTGRSTWICTIYFNGKNRSSQGPGRVLGSGPSTISCSPAACLHSHPVPASSTLNISFATSPNCLCQDPLHPYTTFQTADQPVSAHGCIYTGGTKCVHIWFQGSIGPSCRQPKKTMGSKEAVDNQRPLCFVEWPQFRLKE